MTKEQSSLETDTEQIVRLIEENLKLRKQLADQKQKIISVIRNKIKDLRNANNNHKQDLVKEEELENNVLEELININEKKITELISLLEEFEGLK